MLFYLSTVTRWTLYLVPKERERGREKTLLRKINDRYLKKKKER